jgi:hypothetical protein
MKEGQRMSSRWMFWFCILALTVGPVAAATYTSTLTGSGTFTYDADPNGVYPDSSGYGDFGIISADYVITLDYPQPDQGSFDWYVDPRVNISGWIVNEVPFQIILDEAGLHAILNGQPLADYSWQEMGYTYVSGLGVYLTSMATPASFFPADPDRVLGYYDYDYEPDGLQDFIVEITGAGGNHHFQGYTMRSATWMGLQGTALPSAFADFVAMNLPGIPEELLDIIRAIDLSPLIEIEAMIGTLGGPIEGNDISGEGTFDIRLHVTDEQPTAVRETTWGALKAHFRE